MQDQEPNRFVKIAVSLTEKRFLEYCRALGYAEIEKLVIMRGEPTKIERVVKLERFDLK
jgi:hypothetical protein